MDWNQIALTWLERRQGKEAVRALVRVQGPLTSWPRETVARTRWAGGRPPRITFGPQNVCTQDGRPHGAGAPVGRGRPTGRRSRRGPGRQASGARGELRACVLAKGIDQLAR